MQHGSCEEIERLTGMTKGVARVVQGTSNRKKTSVQRSNRSNPKKWRSECMKNSFKKN